MGVRQGSFYSMLLFRSYVDDFVMRIRVQEAYYKHCVQSKLNIEELRKLYHSSGVLSLR